MKHIANPVEVDAAYIVDAAPDGRGGWHLKIDFGNEDIRSAHATAAMCSRYSPTLGDYWVVQEDGYAYVNPKEVFERKYSKKGVQ
jgi:hypothetical protein